MSCRELERLWETGASLRDTREHRDACAECARPGDSLALTLSALEGLRAPTWSPALRQSLLDIPRRTVSCAGAEPMLAAALEGGALRGRRGPTPEPSLALRRVHRGRPDAVPAARADRARAAALARHAAGRHAPGEEAGGLAEALLGQGRRRVRVRRGVSGHAARSEPDGAADQGGIRAALGEHALRDDGGAELARRSARRAPGEGACARSRCGRATSAATDAPPCRTRSRSCGDPNPRRLPTVRASARKEPPRARSV